MTAYATNYKGPHPAAIRGPESLRQKRNALRSRYFTRALDCRLNNLAFAHRVRILQTRDGMSASNANARATAEAIADAKIVARAMVARSMASTRRKLDK